MLRAASKMYVVGISSLMLLATACNGPAGPALVAVKGNVTLGGVPLEQGVINFAPLETGQGPSRTAEVVNGEYQVNVPLGKFRVSFQATRATGRMVDSYGTPIPEYENIVPPNYRNGVSIEIAADSLSHDFELDDANGGIAK